jgi:hypothetical protein
MAVVVQQLVPADAAGVLFTVNPVTGTSDEMLINATWGLGESLVEGRVAPDTIITEKASGQVKRMEIGDKLVMTVPCESGTVEQAVDPSMRHVAVLSTDQMKELTKTGRAIEQFFKTPQDVEWAIAQGHIFILQSRPVTIRSTLQLALRPQEEYDVPGDDSWDRQNEPPPQPFDLWTRTNLGENFPFPISPLTSTVWPAIFILGDLPKKDQSATDTPPPGIGRRFYGRIYLRAPRTKVAGVPSSASTLPTGLPRGGKLALVCLCSDFRADALRHGECPCFGARTAPHSHVG